MAVKPTVNHIKETIEAKLSRQFGCTASEASRDQIYKAAVLTVKDILTSKRGDFKKRVNQTGSKRVYYMCMEFLLGRSLKTNLCNLGLDGEYKKALSELGYTSVKEFGGIIDWPYETEK